MRVNRVLVVEAAPCYPVVCSTVSMLLQELEAAKVELTAAKAAVQAGEEQSSSAAAQAAAEKETASKVCLPYSCIHVSDWFDGVMH